MNEDGKKTPNIFRDKSVWQRRVCRVCGISLLGRDISGGGTNKQTVAGCKLFNPMYFQ